MAMPVPGRLDATVDGDLYRADQSRPVLPTPSGIRPRTPPSPLRADHHAAGPVGVRWPKSEGSSPPPAGSAVTVATPAADPAAGHR